MILMFIELCANLCALGGRKCAHYLVTDLIFAGVLFRMLERKLLLIVKTSVQAIVVFKLLIRDC